MKRSIKTLSTLILVVMLSLPSIALGANATDQVQVTIDSIISVLRDPALKGDANKESRRAQIRSKMKDRFSFKDMAKRSLGKEWKNLSPEQREEFVSVFKKVIESAYISKIEMFTDEKITYEDARVVKTSAIVKTRVLRSNGTEIPIDYKLITRNDNWMIYDVVVEGISLVRNYRTQFSQVLRKSTYSDLVEQLRAKGASGEAS